MDIISVEFEKSFLVNVKNHEMKVLKDDGFYRHIRFRSPRSISYGFEIITWPGYLSIVGDMGDYVFARTHDMFSFFRNRRASSWDKPGKTIFINPDYWAEKIQAVSRHGDFEVFDESKIKRYILRQFYYYCKYDKLAKKQRRKLKDEIRDDLFDCDLKNEESARDLLYNFSSKYSAIDFDDHSEIPFTRYGTHYGWCLHAIVWGIERYDKAKSDLQKVLLAVDWEAEKNV